VTVNRKKKHLPEARALYAEGLRYVEIARSLDLPPGTVRRWSTEERKAGRPWLRAGESAPSSSGPEPKRSRKGPRSVDRAALCRRLEARLARLIERAEDDLEDAKVEERFLKLCRVLDSLRGDAADLDAQMEAMKRFADFCMQNLTEDEMAPVRGPIRQFIDYLKEEHS